MERITEKELFEFYKGTLEKCGIYLLNEDDEIIEYNIYEDFDIGGYSFFHINNLKRLYENGLISLDKLEKSVSLRRKFIRLQNSNEWGIENFRTSENWKEIMLLSDEIKRIE